MSATATSLPRDPARATQLLGMWLGAGVAALAAFFALGWWAHPEQSRVLLCGFRALTGIPCPGCGMTRAMAALARGEWTAALRYHPFAPLVLAEGAWLWAAVGAALLRGRALAISNVLLQRLVIWQAAAFVALWLGRLATGTLPY